MEKTNKFLGICIAAGLAFLGLMIPKAVNDYKSFDRTVSVKGLCEREVPADRVIWPIIHKVVGNDLMAVNSEILRKNEAIRKFVTAAGVPASDVTVSAAKISDKYAQEYGGNDRAFRYVATCTITVCSSEVAKVMKLMGSQNALLDQGVVVTSDWDTKPVFSFENLNSIKPGMIEEATRNARQVAEKFAADSDSHLGKIKDASQGTFSIESRDTNTPEIKKIRVVTYVTYYLR